MTTVDFEKRIAELMKSISYKKRKYSFIKQIDENIFGIIGFGSVSYQIRGTVFVHPTVGIYNKAVDDIFHQLTNLKGDGYYQPVINTSFGYLTPQNEYKEWLVNDDNIDSVNLELIDVIKLYGLPFIEKYKDPEILMKCVADKKYILSENRDYILPILYYLNGDKHKGLQYIEDNINQSNNPVYSKYYENYRDL